MSSDVLNESTDSVEVSASQLNIRGVYLHVLGDALGSVIVMISALIILYEHGEWTLFVDPSMSIIMVVCISFLIDIRILRAAFNNYSSILTFFRPPIIHSTHPPSPYVRFSYIGCNYILGSVRFFTH